MTNKIGRFLSVINLAVELGSNFTEKIGQFCWSPVISLRLQKHLLAICIKNDINLPLTVKTA